MNITAKSKYAVRGLVELAERSNGKPVSLVEVAEARGIPARFLEQLFATLRKGGILSSVRGVNGGFRFGRSADEVTVLDVVQLLDGPLGAALCTVSDGCDLRPVCAAADVWLQAKLATEGVLAGATIQDLADWERARGAVASPAGPAVRGEDPGSGASAGGEAVERVRRIIADLGSAVVAFSGGVDSTVLLALALSELGYERVLAATVHGDVHTTEELEAARLVAATLGARHVVVETRELLVPGFAQKTRIPVTVQCGHERPQHALQMREDCRRRMFSDDSRGHRRHFMLPAQHLVGGYVPIAACPPVRGPGDRHNLVHIGVFPGGGPGDHLFSFDRQDRRHRADVSEVVLKRRRQEPLTEHQPVTYQPGQQRQRPYQAG